MMVKLSPDGTRGTRLTSFGLFRLTTKFNAALYRLLGGFGMSRRSLLITTVGARSGCEHTTPVWYVADGDRAWVVVASSGGAAKHPAWCRNIARHPERVRIQVGRYRLRVRPEFLTDPERLERWQLAVARMPSLAKYQDRTDRTIPVIRLTPSE